MSVEYILRCDGCDEVIGVVRHYPGGIVGLRDWLVIGGGFSGRSPLRVDLCAVCVAGGVVPDRERWAMAAQVRKARDG